jgi:hypothetical protein
MRKQTPYLSLGMGKDSSATAKSSGHNARLLRQALLALVIAGVAGLSTGCVLWVHDDDYYHHHHYYDHDGHWEHHDHD